MVNRVIGRIKFAARQGLDLKRWATLINLVEVRTVPVRIQHGIDPDPAI
jgi:hypothetical protein